MREATFALSRRTKEALARAARLQQTMTVKQVQAARCRSASWQSGDCGEQPKDVAKAE